MYIAYIELEPWEKKKKRIDPVTKLPTYERKWEEQLDTEKQQNFTAPSAPQTTEADRKAQARAQQLEERVDNARWLSDPDPLWTHTPERKERKQKVSYDAFLSNKPLYDLWEGDYNAFLARTLPPTTKDLETSVSSHLTDGKTMIFKYPNSSGFITDLEWDLDDINKQINEINHAIQAYSLSGQADSNAGIDPDGIDPQRDRLFAERESLLELYEQTKRSIEPERALAWEQKQLDEIIAAGGMELLEMMKMELEMEENEMQYNSYEYYELHKEAEEWLNENSPKIRALAGDHYDTWKAYVQRMVNAELYDEIKAGIQQELDTHLEGYAAVFARRIPHALRGIGAVDLLVQRADRWITGSDIPLDYKTVAQYPGMIDDSVIDTIAKDFSIVTGGGGEENFGSTAFRTAMGVDDELVETALELGAGGAWGSLLSDAADMQKSLTDAYFNGDSFEKGIQNGVQSIIVDYAKSKFHEKYWDAFQKLYEAALKMK